MPSICTCIYQSLISSTSSLVLPFQFFALLSFPLDQFLVFFDERVDATSFVYPVQSAFFQSNVDERTVEKKGTCKSVWMAWALWSRSRWNIVDICTSRSLAIRSL
uniref:Secreted protein n=1 Tax=Meloidogyne incognita TaxID=6306 RepID=A0A914M505_MELIC